MVQVSREKEAPGPPVKDRPLSLPVPGDTRCRWHSPLRHHSWSHPEKRESLYFALYTFLTFTNDLNVFNDCKKNTYRKNQNPRLCQLRAGVLRGRGLRVGRIIKPKVTRHGVLLGGCHSAFWATGGRPGTTQPHSGTHRTPPAPTLNEALSHLTPSCTNTALCLKASQRKCQSHKNSGCGNGQFSFL